MFFALCFVLDAQLNKATVNELSKARLVYTCNWMASSRPENEGEVLRDNLYQRVALPPIFIRDH